MGSITSRPKIPTAAVTTAAVVTPQTTESSSAVTTSPTVASPDEVAKSRVETVLRRSRSVLGNVLTSYRGLLNENSTAPHRKSLLGE